MTAMRDLARMLVLLRRWHEQRLGRTCTACPRPATSIRSIDGGQHPRCQRHGSGWTPAVGLRTLFAHIYALEKDARLTPSPELRERRG